MLRRVHTLRLTAPVSLALLMAVSAPAVAAPTASRTPMAPIISGSDETPDVLKTPFSAAERLTPTASPPLSDLTFPTAVDSSTYASDHVLVRFASQTTPSQKRSSLSALGSPVGEAVDGTGWVRVAVADQDPLAAVALLDADPRVAEVAVDHVRHAAALPDDPGMGWAPYFDLLRLPRAWDAGTGAGAVVAVLDTGVAGALPDLAGSALPGTSFVGGDPGKDVNGHGTLVAGVVAARGNNGVGSVGAAFGAKILPVKVLDDSGAGTDSTIASGIAWAAAHGADVINVSLGGREPAPILLTAIQNAVAAGAVVVAAAGNDGTDAPFYPAAYAPDVDGLMAVSATDGYGALAGFSGWGDWVSLAAPGKQVVGPALDGSYGYGNGTSFAAPFVSGVAALVAARATALTPAQIEKRLVSTAVDAGPRGSDPYYGAGVLDAAAALTKGDAVPAAAGVPLDRAPGDLAPSDDTPAMARPLAGSIDSGSTGTGTLSPEGDVDWFAADAPTSGWYLVTVTPLDAGDAASGPTLDLAFEVRDGAGHVLRRTNEAGANAQEQLWAPMKEPGGIFVGVRNANGSAPSLQRYEIRVVLYGAPRPFTASRQLTAPASPGQRPAQSRRGM